MTLVISCSIPPLKERGETKNSSKTTKDSADEGQILAFADEDDDFDFDDLEDEDSDDMDFDEMSEETIDSSGVDLKLAPPPSKRKSLTRISKHDKNRNWENTEKEKLDRNKKTPVKIITTTKSNFPNIRISSHSLIRAAAIGTTEMLRHILDSGTNINFQNRRGITALISAVKHNRTENVRLLLENNAKTNIRDKNGSTAMRIAKRRGYKNIIKALKKNLAAGSGQE